MASIHRIYPPFPPTSSVSIRGIDIGRQEKCFSFACFRFTVGLPLLTIDSVSLSLFFDAFDRAIFNGTVLPIKRFPGTEISYVRMKETVERVLRSCLRFRDEKKSVIVSRPFTIVPRTNSMEKE